MAPLPQLATRLRSLKPAFVDQGLHRSTIFWVFLILLGLLPAAGFILLDEPTVEVRYRANVPDEQGLLSTNIWGHPVRGEFSVEARNGIGVWLSVPTTARFIPSSKARVICIPDVRVRPAGVPSLPDTVLKEHREMLGRSTPKLLLSDGASLSVGALMHNPTRAAALLVEAGIPLHSTTYKQDSSFQLAHRDSTKRSRLYFYREDRAVQLGADSAISRNIYLKVNQLQLHRLEPTLSLELDDGSTVPPQHALLVAFRNMASLNQLCGNRAPSNGVLIVTAAFQSLELQFAERLEIEADSLGGLEGYEVAESPGIFRRVTISGVGDSAVSLSHLWATQVDSLHVQGVESASYAIGDEQLRSVETTARFHKFKLKSNAPDGTTVTYSPHGALRPLRVEGKSDEVFVAGERYPDSRVARLTLTQATILGALIGVWGIVIIAVWRQLKKQYAGTSVGDV